MNVRKFNYMNDEFCEKVDKESQTEHVFNLHCATVKHGIKQRQIPEIQGRSLKEVAVHHDVKRMF